MTNYDEWKTTETFSDEAEFVAKRKGELLKEWSADETKVAEAISDALADDVDGRIPAMLAKFYCVISGRWGDPSVTREAFWLRGCIDAYVDYRLERDAETAAQAAYDNRLTGPEGDL